MKTRIATIGAIGSLIVTSYVVDAHATWFRNHGAACMGMSDGTLGYTYIFNDYDYATGSLGDSAQELMCAPPDTSALQRNAYKTINVETWSDNGGAFTGALCEDFWSGNGGRCSNFVSTSGSGHKTIVLGGQVGVNGTWTTGTETNFGYVYVSIPAAGGGINSVRGIYYST